MQSAAIMWMIPFSDLASGIYMMYCDPDCSDAKRSPGWMLRQRGEERKERSLSNRRRRKDKQTNRKSTSSDARLRAALSLLFHLCRSLCCTPSHCIYDVSETTAAVFLLYHPTALLLHWDPEPGSVSTLKVKEVSSIAYRLLTDLIVSFILSILTSSEEFN